MLQYHIVALSLHYKRKKMKNKFTEQTCMKAITNNLPEMADFIKSHKYEIAMSYLKGFLYGASIGISITLIILNW